jgi:oligopeptide transport system substrate-binding protein
VKRNTYTFAGVAVLGIASIALAGCAPADDSDAGQVSGPALKISSNADGGHEGWINAVANSISGTLGIPVEADMYPDFASYLDDRDAEKIPGAFRAGWQGDYPGLYNFLGALYTTGAESNDSGYSSEEFDALVADGISEADPDKASALFNQAQEVLLQDLPVIPLWYQNAVGGWSENVDNVEFGWDSVPLFDEITKNTDGPVIANGTEPQNPILPSRTDEVGGGRVLDTIFAGLVAYNADGSIENDAAESIVQDSPTQFTITVRDGLTFTNGEPVDADSFINAWNYGAIASNAQKSTYFFQDIEGFVNTEEQYGAPDEGLSGLKKIDDLTFQVTLNKPAADFAQRLGYAAYFPLPEVAFEDMDAFGENPIGNGPFKFDGEGAWQHDVQIALVKNEDYDGPSEAQAEGLTFKFYASFEAAYNDLLANNLDVLDTLPDLAYETYEDELGDRSVNQPGALNQTLAIGEYVEHFGPDEEGTLRRQAISMAIDREAITEKIFFGTRQPATDFTSPALDGWTDELEGDEVLEYNPEKAKELWDQANEISPWE